jgi:hypothetical protein
MVISVKNDFERRTLLMWHIDAVWAAAVHESLLIKGTAVL